VTTDGRSFRPPRDEPEEEPADGEVTRGEVRKKAVRGAAWTIALGLGSRVLQLLGTLAITYFLPRDVMGEVQNAAIFALNAHMFTTFGLPTVIAVRKMDPRAAFHATFLLTVSGLVALGAAIALSGPSGFLLKSPHLGKYLVPLAIATLLMRVATVPERMLQFQLRFREAGLARSAGEMAYTIGTVGAAFLLHTLDRRGALAEMGASYVDVCGWALVAGQLARGAVALVAGAMYVDPRAWARPHRLDRGVIRELLGFGVPLGIALWFSFAARSLDNLVVSALFGTAVVGAYNLAYQLADIPATQIGEQIGDVLTSSFARLDGEARRSALPKALSLTALVVFPLAFGLGVTATTVVSTLLRAEWRSAGPMLAVLAVLSVTRPVGWLVGAYLQTTQRSKPVMWLSVFRLVAVLGAVGGLGKLFGPLGACAGVGVAFSLHALGNVAWVVRQDGFKVGELLGGTGRVLVACALLCAAVLGARAGLSSAGVHVRGVNLAVEILAGAAGYGAGVLLVARGEAAGAIRLLRDLRRDRKSQGS
jgi:lipopolysaccharide exporter